MKNLQYLTLLTYAVIISGYLASLIFPRNAVAGYSTVVVGLFTLTILKIVPLTHIPELKLASFIPILPMVIIMGICVWLLSINIKYDKNIKDGNVTKEYKVFNSISFILLLIQLVVLYKDNMPYANYVISLVASFQIIVVFILQMNLEYFMTDG